MSISTLRFVLETSALLGAAVAGLGFGLSLIIAIGAQNVFILRQGIRREHVLPIVLFCAISDAVLISLGVLGLGGLLALAPWLIVITRWGGVAFLVAYGVLALRRAIRGEELIDADAQPAPSSLRATMLAIAALTWLNPHVYLDTVMLMGSVANTYGEARWGFWGGAVTGSFVWFFALGYGARWLQPLFRNPRAWRILDVVIALTMFGIALSLAFGG